MLNPNGTVAQKAKQEGQVVWYVPTLGNINAIANAFTAKYGVKVNMVELPSTELQARFASEAQAGQHAADVVTSGYSTFFGQALGNGWLTPLKKVLPGFPGSYPSGYVYDNGGTAVNMIAATGIAYNTTKINGSKVPTSWSQLANPVYKGTIISVDPNASLAYLNFWNMILDKYGAKVVSAIGKNIVQQYATAPAEMQALTSGAGNIVLFTTAGLTAPTTAKGAPVAYKQFSVTTGADFAVGIAAHAPDPAAAELFAAWMLSRSGEETFDKLGLSSSPLVPTSLPAQYVQPVLSLSTATKDKIDSLLGVSTTSP